MPITIAVLKESGADERRVAVDPGTAERLEKLGASLVVQAGAGERARFPDAAYPKAKKVKTLKSVLKDADVAVRVQPPPAKDVASMKEGAVLVSFVYAHLNRELVEALCQRKVTTLAMELIPRITRAQAMDALSSQATIAGYKAAVMAASLSGRIFPMLTTAAGTIRPSRVVVIGAGVAGLQAIATARRLGAQVEAYDIRPAAREQVESLGARMIDTGVSAEGSGGYARELTDEEKAKQAEVLASHIARANAVISTAAVPGREAPKIITRAMVEGMAPGAVIVDLAAETGGNCELTEPGKTIEHNGVVVHGPLDVPSSGAIHASEMYGRNILNLLSLMIEEGELKLDLEDDVIAGCLLTHDGEVKHEATRKLLEGGA